MFKVCICELLKFHVCLILIHIYYNKLWQDLHH